ncbi:hypothetical protein, partial [Streptomyces canarius]
KSSQELERTQTELKIAEAEAKKEKKIEGQGIAEYNEIIKKSMSDEMIKYQWIQKWDGKMPKATGKSNSLIQIPTDEEGIKPKVIPCQGIFFVSGARI